MENQNNFKEGSIAKEFEILRTNLLLTHKDIANLLNTTEKELKELTSLKDEEISFDILFRLYYCAQAVIDNPYREEFTHKLAQTLKIACNNELNKRV